MFHINGKTVDKITENDLNQIIDNHDYIENQYLEYKECFAFWDEQLPKAIQTEKAIEFKKDICSFANAEGGYIIIGISDKNGLANELLGVEIADDNKDVYERNIRDKLANIQPKTPSVKVHFVKLQNVKYIVILEIIADGFAPYVYNSGNDTYDFVSRDGNGKRRMSYNQVMRMFNQSLVMKKEIDAFRQNRVKLYSELSETPLYCRIYVISEDFIDVPAHKNLYMMYRENHALIKCPSGFDFVSPNIDGIRFIPFKNSHEKEAYLSNGGICELNVNLKESHYLSIDNGWRLWGYDIWDNQIIKFVKYAINHFSNFKFSKKAFVCFDLACYKGTVTEKGDYYNSIIDRPLIMSSIIEIEDLSNNDILNQAIRALNYEYYMALGLRNDGKYKEIETKIYI